MHVQICTCVYKPIMEVANEQTEYTYTCTLVLYMHLITRQDSLFNCTFCSISCPDEFPFAVVTVTYKRCSTRSASCSLNFSLAYNIYTYMYMLHTYM